jgi:hypothetical protein
MAKKVRRKIKIRQYSFDEICFFGTEPNKAKKIRIEGRVYKQIGYRFFQCFASLDSKFVRFSYNWTVCRETVTRENHRGRTMVKLSDDNSKILNWQALKFVILAWNLPDMELPPDARYFGYDFQLDHINSDKTDNNAVNGQILTKEEHDTKTKLSAEQQEKKDKAHRKPVVCHITKGDDKITIRYESREIAEQELGLKRWSVTWNMRSHCLSNLTIKKGIYDGCMATFENIKIELQPGEQMREIDYAELGLTRLKTFEEVPFEGFVTETKIGIHYVTTHGQYVNANGIVRKFVKEAYPRINISGKMVPFHRIVCSAFNKEQTNAYIALKLEQGEVWTFATLDVHHMDEDATNQFANNLQALTHQRNNEISNGDPCLIWITSEGEGTAKRYNSVKKAALAAKMDKGTLIKILQGKKIRNIAKNKKYSGRYL